MKTRILIIGLLICTLPACISSPRQDYTVELAPDSIDTYDMLAGGRLLGPTPPSRSYFEKITAVPEGYELKYTYNIPLQQRQFTYQSFLEDTSARARYFEDVPEESFAEWEKDYTTDTVDCIATAGAVESPAGELELIFDRNNDEDLSNDPIAAPHTQSYYFAETDTSREFTYIDGQVQIDYYDGSGIQTTTRTLRMDWAAKDRGYLAQSSARGYFGWLTIGGERYRVGLLNRGDIEYTKYDDLWLDLNQNGRHDSQIDLQEQMYLPFTIQDRAYLVTHVGRFGRTFTLRACDPDSIPPVAVGLPAPDFIETTIDSTQFQLHDLQGKYVILDFWTCNSPIGLSRFYDIYKKYKNHEHVAFVSVGPYTPERYPPDMKDIAITWPHIHGLFDVPVRELYQVAGENTTFIIDPEGIIVEKEVFARPEKISALLEKHLK